MKIWGERGERQGGVAHRIGRKTAMEERATGERGVMGRGKGGPEEVLHRGNKGGKIAKHSRGRVEEMWK
jgi:hypothetical protein